MGKTRTLPGSGTLSMSQIVGEFSKGNTFSSYYGAASGIPASGRMSVSDFYGKASGPPPATPGIIWDGTGTPPAWSMPSLRITQNASPVSGSPNNIASTTAHLDAPMSGRMAINPADPPAYTRFVNPKMEMKFAVHQWAVASGQLGCKIKVSFQLNSAGPDFTDGTPRHRLYGEPSPGAAKVIFHEKTGAYFSGSADFTTTQTIYDYIQNGQSLVFDAHYCLGNSSNYNRFVGGAYSNVRIQKIEAVV